MFLVWSGRCHILCIKDKSQRNQYEYICHVVKRFKVQMVFPHFPLLSGQISNSKHKSFISKMVLFALRTFLLRLYRCSAAMSMICSMIGATINIFNSLHFCVVRIQNHKKTKKNDFFSLNFLLLDSSSF